MSVQLKALETVYNGYRFRSRLEARWAVFFDTLGVKYEYEKEGFEMDKGVWYLPDFYLPEDRVWVEIKPNRALTTLEIQKCIGLGLHEPLFVFMGSHEIPTPDGQHGVWARAFLPGNKTNNSFSQTGTGLHHQPRTALQAVLRSSGELMYPPDICYLDPRRWCWHERNDGSFLIWPVPALEATEEETGMTMFLPGRDGAELAVNILPPFTTKHIDSPRLVAAYTAARQARFEFGEHGGRAK